MQTPENKTPSSESTAERLPKKWYREFWAWFILSPLIVVVFVSSYTVSLAVSNADDRVIDDYYKEGRMINMRLDEDMAAANMELTADIAIDHELSDIVVTLKNTQNEFPESLTLEFSHPLDKTFDYDVTLSHIAKGQYQAELQQTLEYRWYLRLRPVITMAASTTATASEASVSQNVDPHSVTLWRLRGEIDFSQQSVVRLQSSF